MTKPLQNHILLPLERPFQYTKAVTAAIRIAIAYQKPLLLLHVYSPYLKEAMLPSGTASLNSLPAGFDPKAETEKKLDAFCKDIRKQYPLLESCDWEMRKGLVKEELLAAIEEKQPEWTVLSEAQEPGFLVRLIGNLPTDIAKNAPSPILVVPEGETPFMPRSIAYVCLAERENHEGFASVARLARKFQSSFRVIELVEKLPENTVEQIVNRQEALAALLRIPHLEYSLEVGNSLEDAVEEKLRDGLFDLVVMHHNDQSLLERFFQGDSTKNLVLETEKPLVVL